MTASRRWDVVGSVAKLAAWSRDLDELGLGAPWLVPSTAEYPDGLLVSGEASADLHLSIVQSYVTAGLAPAPTTADGIALHHIDVIVPDVRGAQRELERLGCVTVVDAVRDGGEGWLLLAPPGRFEGAAQPYLELTSTRHSERAVQWVARHGLGIDHVCLSSPDVPAVCRALTSPGTDVRLGDFAGLPLAWAKRSGSIDIEILGHEAEEFLVQACAARSTLRLT